MVIHLILTTLAEEEAQLIIDLQEYDGLREFENAVLEQLPELGTSSAFCCELDFVCRDSQQKLVDPQVPPPFAASRRACYHTKCVQF